MCDQSSKATAVIRVTLAGRLRHGPARQVLEALRGLCSFADHPDEVIRPPGVFPLRRLAEYPVIRSSTSSLPPQSWRHLLEVRIQNICEKKASPFYQIYAPEVIFFDAAYSPHLSDLTSSSNDLDANVGAGLDHGVFVVSKLRWRRIRVPFYLARDKLCFIISLNQNFGCSCSSSCVGLDRT